MSTGEAAGTTATQPRTLHIQRLNLDSSWWIGWGGAGLVLDPWLIGSEVDIARWFNEQWHVLDPVSPEDLPPHDAVLVTQSYSDHCHEQTLRMLDPSLPLYGSPKAVARMRRDPLLAPRVQSIPDALSGETLAMGNLHCSMLDPRRRMDPVYYGLLLEHEGEALVYAPHGFALDAALAERLEGLRVRLVMSTCITYRLPGLLGGTVNPGLNAALRLARACSAEALIDTHDEDKRARGLVHRVARVLRPSPEAIRQAMPPGMRFLRTEGYRPLELA